MSADIADGRTTLLLAEDHPMVVVALHSAFELVDDIEVVATTGSIAETVSTASQILPDVILLDRRLPDGNGIDAITVLRQVSPQARVLVFTGDADRDTLNRVMEAGGAGLVLKTGLFDDLLGIIRRVAAGENHFDVDL
ncbi:response regulator transcription factor [Nocardia sp. NEAU-G5]|uniref:Response regulator transcription factor n=1 Tax=Nocardia albiluteola TaxID=2842303 RepID=A0ABS6B3Z0_9NOCA|nr:response regulator transcription factor [Nocardia albiluteola]MBU3064838.1 response regulator transcription factor [Nocardia albiluteola]